MSQTKKIVAAATIIGAIAASAATAQEMTLKVSHTYAANHYLVVNGIDVMLQQIERESNGQIKFEVYPAGQLGKDQLGNLASGLTDIVYVSPSVESTALGLSTVVELPGSYATACDGAVITEGLMKPGAILDQEELAPRGLHFLYATTFPPYTVFSGTKPLTSVEDLNGMKIRAGGAAITKAFRAVGAVPIQVPGAELYDAIKRGTLDGAFFPEVAVPSYDLQEVFGHALLGTDLGSASSFTAVSTKVWDGLSDAQKKIFTDAAAAAQKNVCEWMDTESKKVLDDMVQNHGLKTTTLNADQYKALHETLAPVRAEWVAEMAAAGKKGQEVLAAADALGAK